MVGLLVETSGGGSGKRATVPQAEKEAGVQHVREGELGYVEEQAFDFQGQPFLKCKPLLKLAGVNNPTFTDVDECWSPSVACKAILTKVLGFRELARPNIGFPGYWLKGLGIMIHIIQHDPTVPCRLHDWKEQYIREPEAWFIRHGSHLVLEVENFVEAERVLERHGVECSHHVLPDANMQQLFFFNPEGNGVEVGRYEDMWAFLRRHGEENGWL